MAVGYIDMSRYFQNTSANPGYRVLMDPRTGQITTQKKVGSTGQLWQPVPDFNLGQFYGNNFASAHGLPTKGPGGEALFGAKSWDQVMGNLDKTFGVDFLTFMSSDPTKREQLYSIKQGYGKDSKTGLDALFDPRTGLPNRPPRNAEEAIQFQFRADQESRRLNQGLLNNAIGTLRYGLAGVNRGGPFSSYGMMSPLLGQMSSTYMNSQYQSPDYSYFLRPDVPGYGNNGGYGGGGGQIPTIPSIPGYGGFGTQPVPERTMSPAGMVRTGI